MPPAIAINFTPPKDKTPSRNNNSFAMLPFLKNQYKYIVFIKNIKYSYNLFTVNFFSDVNN